MEEIQEKKREIRNEMIKFLSSIPEKKREQMTKAIEDRLFEFANFLEANISLLYMNGKYEVATREIINRTLKYNKIVVLPAFDMEKRKVRLMKVDNLDTNLIMGPKGVLEPDENKCKKVPIECIDIAIIPGIAFDEKGARIGTGTGFYDRLIPDLPITTRKVSLAFEGQILPQVPMESHDKHVD
ncbi:MAG: 5-formyltetrahydrofolate cyclo-ligase, partial [Deltaproteobacteria bacterium]|nr:5-formyltetrahydrofolate cyclo-ligase [Deltaproteobacteria bacterium]